MAVYEFNLPEYPASRRVNNRTSVKSVKVRKVADKPSTRQFVVVTNVPGFSTMALWEDDDYDTQKDGDGFTQAAIEAKIAADLPSL